VTFGPETIYECSSGHLGGSSTRAVFCLSYTTIVKKEVPFGESCPGTHRISDIFITLEYSRPPDGFRGMCKFVNKRFVGLWQVYIRG
jgi:hypothetical protein